MSDSLHLFVLEECETEEDRWNYCTRAWEWLQMWKTPAKGAKTPCVPWGDYDLTIQEAKRRLNEMMGLINDREEWEKCFLKLPRRLQRGRKTRRPADRLKDYLLAVMRGRKRNGAWTSCPTIDYLAAKLELSRETIKRAFKELENDSDLKFRSMNKQQGRGRVKMFALVEWLRHDQEPLLFTQDMKPRGVRESFRKSAEPPKKSKRISIRRPRRWQKTTKDHFCLSYSYRVLKNQQSHHFNKASVPAAMMKIASQIVQGSKMPHFNRLEITKREIAVLIGRELRSGAWRSDAKNTVFNALIVTDMAMSDFDIQNPVGYAQGVIDKSTKKRVSRGEIRQRNIQFWRDELAKHEQELKAAVSQNDDIGARVIRSMVERCRAKLAA